MPPRAADLLRRVDGSGAGLLHISATSAWRTSGTRVVRAMAPGGTRARGHEAMSARAAGAHEKYNVDEQDAGGHEAKASKKEAILEQRRERARQEARRHNKHLRVTRRPRKPDAPGGWEALWSEASGKWFFWCPLTGATTWERRECTHTQANLRTALGELPAGESPYRRGQASAGSSQARPPRTPRVRLLAARPPSPRAAADEHARAPVTASTPKSRIGPHPPSTSESAAALRRTHRPSTSERRPTPRRGAADTVDDMPYKLGATTRPSTAPSRARSPLVGSSAASARHSVRVTLATGGQSWRTRARAALPREFRHVKSVPAASEAALGESAAPGDECYQIGSYVRLKDLDVPLSNGALSHNQPGWISLSVIVRRCLPGAFRHGRFDGPLRASRTLAEAVDWPAHVAESEWSRSARSRQEHFTFRRCSRRVGRSA